MEQEKYIGKIYKNRSQNLYYRVNKILEKNPKGTLFEIEFIETGFKTKSYPSDFTRGRVKDWYAKTIFGVACKGKTKTSSLDRKYRVWQNMLARCYYKKSNEYKRYGEKGVKVCERWLVFENFEKDIEKIKGYDEKLFYDNKIQLDKDLYGGKIYSPTTCIFLSPKENVRIIYS